MESRVENRDVGNTLEDLLAGLDSAQIRRHVQRSELDELLQGRHRLFGDERGILEDFGAVKDAVSDGVDVLGISEIGDHLLQRLGMVGWAAGADALDEPLGEPLFLLHVEELVLERTRT